MRSAARAVGLAIVVANSASACASGSSGVADCGSQIKSDGVVFSSYGSTLETGHEYGVALEADCEDVGDDARGSVFNDDARRLTTYRFAGYEPSEVLGVKYGQSRRYTVFVADSVSRDDAERIYKELDPSHE